MKTKNNVQKTGLWLASVVVSLFLISYTVSGQDFFEKLLGNGHLDKIAMTSETTKENIKTPAHNAGNKAILLFEKAADPILEVEEWMHCNKCFGTAETRFEAETEMALEIKEWMLEESLFNGDKDYESPLEVETWMLNEKNWAI